VLRGVVLKARLEFFGAAGEVTGSRTVLQFAGSTILVDCGLFQGRKEIKGKNWEPCCEPVPSKIDAVVLTHAHLDHSGYLPRLWKQGFRGRIFCSKGTADLVRLLLLDAAHLEEEQASFANRTGYSHHKPAYPLFTTEDAESVLKLLVPCDRNAWIQLSDVLSFQFLRAGHIIGASLIQFSLHFDWGTRLLTFSGDLGHSRSATMREPEKLVESDFIVLESTYGDRLHPRESVMDQLGAIARKTIQRGGVLVIPAFAVGRAQEIIYIFRMLEDAGAIKPVPIILDSPLSSAATRVFQSHPEDHKLGSVFNGSGPENFEPRYFETTVSPDDSMLACMREGPLVVISAAGMLTGGRILHHLKARLPESKNTIVLSGYQAEGTKGRWLQDNVGTANTMRIHHLEIPLEAEVVTIDSLSAHGDYQDFIDWLGCMSKLPKKIFLNHGEKSAVLSFSEKLRRSFQGVEVVPLVEPTVVNLTPA